MLLLQRLFLPDCNNSYSEQHVISKGNKDNFLKNINNFSLLKRLKLKLKQESKAQIKSHLRRLRQVAEEKILTIYHSKTEDAMYQCTPSPEVLCHVRAEFY